MQLEAYPYRFTGVWHLHARLYEFENPLLGLVQVVLRVIVVLPGPLLLIVLVKPADVMVDVPGYFAGEDAIAYPLVATRYELPNEPYPRVTTGPIAILRCPRRASRNRRRVKRHDSSGRRTV
jgi:hypothetical protein